MMLVRSHDGAGVVNGMDLKSIGLWPRRFESCPSCNFFAVLCAVYSVSSSTNFNSSPTNGKTWRGGVLSFQFHPADDNHFNEYQRARCH